MIDKPSRPNLNDQRHQAAQAKPWHLKGWVSNGYRYMRHKGRVALVHRVLWESVNGPLPPHHRLHFKNGDRNDIRLDNLACLPDTGKLAASSANAG